MNKNNQFTTNARTGVLAFDNVWCTILGNVPMKMCILFPKIFCVFSNQTITIINQML